MQCGLLLLDQYITTRVVRLHARTFNTIALYRTWLVKWTQPDTLSGCKSCISTKCRNAISMVPNSDNDKNKNYFFTFLLRDT